MTSIAEDFLVAAENKAFDTGHRRIINYNIGKYDAAVSRGLFEELSTWITPSARGM